MYMSSTGRVPCKTLIGFVFVEKKSTVLSCYLVPASSPTSGQGYYKVLGPLAMLAKKDTNYKLQLRAQFHLNCAYLSSG